MESKLAIFKPLLWEKLFGVVVGRSLLPVRKATCESADWTQVVREAVKLKKEAFKAWMAKGSSEAADR